MATQYGGIISPDNLETLRKQGRTDDDIAEQMAQVSPNFSSQLSKIRKKYGGDPSATTAFLNTRFYGVVDHVPEQPKGFIGRSLERIYDNYKKDITDIGSALEQRQQGKQGFIDTAGQIAGNLMSIAASPVSQPFYETIGTVAKGAYENVPGIKPLAQEIGKSSIVQKGVLPAIQGTAQFLQEESARNPSLRTLGAVGEGLADLSDVYGVGVLSKGALRAGQPMAGAVYEAAKTPFQTTGKLVGEAARIGTQPIRSMARGFMQGVRGQSDDISKQIAQGLDNATLSLSGPAEAAVKAGMDEKVIKFAVQQSPETRKAMSAMTKAAKAGSAKLGGDTAHKEILGSYMLNNIDYVLTEKSVVGKALGAMKKGMADEVIDMTDDLMNLQTELRKVGAVINEKGQIIRLAAEADDNIPMLQEALNFLTPDDAGRVVKRFGDVDMWRSKMFKEMNSAKAKLQPSASGQSTFGYSERVVNNLRRSAIQNAAQMNPRLLAYNDAFEELSTQASKFLKAIGYKGKLSIDDITAKDLRTGEIALRSLGNASADVIESFKNLINTARKYGYQSGVNEDSLIRWADTLEDIFPITPTRSLQGGVSRGTRDAFGNLTEDILRTGPKRSLTGVASEKIMEGIDKLRGMTPENQYKLLLEVLEAPDGTPLVKAIDNVLDDVPESVKQAVKGIDVKDVRPTDAPSGLQASVAQSPQGNLALESAQQSSPESIGAKSSPTTIPEPPPTVNPPQPKFTPELQKKFPNLTPEEIASLTPEEKSLGAVGGSDSVGGGVKVKKFTLDSLKGKPPENIGTMSVKELKALGDKTNSMTVRGAVTEELGKRGVLTEDAILAEMGKLKGKTPEGLKKALDYFKSTDPEGFSKEITAIERTLAEQVSPSPLPKPLGGSDPLAPLMKEEMVIGDFTPSAMEARKRSFISYVTSDIGSPSALQDKLGTIVANTPTFEEALVKAKSLKSWKNAAARKSIESDMKGFYDYQAVKDLPF